MGADAGEAAGASMRENPSGATATGEAVLVAADRPTVRGAEATADQLVSLITGALVADAETAA
jgi:hypothetical protein